MARSRPTPKSRRPISSLSGPGRTPRRGAGRRTQFPERVAAVKTRTSRHPKFVSTPSSTCARAPHPSVNAVAACSRSPAHLRARSRPARFRHHVRQGSRSEAVYGEAAADQGARARAPVRFARAESETSRAPSQLVGKRKLHGTLRGYDQFMNLVVEDTIEIISLTEKNAIGTVVIRGAHRPRLCPRAIASPSISPAQVTRWRTSSSWREKR